MMYDACIGNDAISLSKKVLEKLDQFWGNFFVNLKNAHTRVPENSRIWEKPNKKKIKTLSLIF